MTKKQWSCALVLGIVLTTGCSFKKKAVDAPKPPEDKKEDSGGSAASPAPAPNPAPSSVESPSLQINADDWLVETGLRGKAQAVLKTLKPERVELIRKNFRVPRLSPLSVSESNGFELYEIRGYKELESAVYVQPKVYINTGNGQGQVLGYRSGKKDPNGKDLIQISLPLALVNGLVPNIPTLGGPVSGVGAAVTLPAKYQIPDVEALKGKVGKEVSTLPICPKLFRLTFEGREYWARSPFERLSACPMNQFFRVTFEAPVEEMRRLLETAAVRDEAVSVIANLSVGFDLPRQVVDLSFSPSDFAAKLAESIKRYAPTSQDQAGKAGYAVQDIEEAILSSLFTLAKESGFEPEYSSSLLAVLSPLAANYFGFPYACGAGGLCRNLLQYPSQRVPVRFSWVVSEELAAALETEAVTGLGAVANSSEFLAKPARDQLSLLRRPAYFRGREFKDVIKECSEMVAANFTYIPETAANDAEYFKAYCKAVGAEVATEDDDGYYPLGSNTVVYPGAWLKIDIDDISEFTTAKTRSLADGRMIIESEVVDLLALNPNAKRTQCLEGNAIACTEYRTKQIPVRSSSGDPMYSNEPCKRGDAGCDCVRQPESTEEVCTRKQYLLQQAMDFGCDSGDEYEFCPYWRSQEDIVDYEIEYDCQNVKTGDFSSFLCIFGCGEKWDYQCKEKSRKPIKAIRQKLNCKEDDETGTAVREKACRAPKYRCKTWSTHCTRYTVNESFHIVHEDVVPKWRPFAIQKGEYPKRFEEDVLLKLESPGRTVTNCRLNRFQREFRGNTIFIKMPSEKNEGIQPCDRPIWDDHNTQPLYLPKVYLKNAISYPERRLCGKTEYSFTTKELPLEDGEGLVPPKFSHKTETRIGPIREACRAENAVQIGSDLWFTEYPAIRFSGRVSVLGRVIESIVTETRP